MYLVYDGLFDKLRRIYFRKLLGRYATAPECRLLDYGCGPGDMLEECRRRGVTACGIDNSQRSVELARARGLEVLLAEYEQIPAALGEFDVILLQSVLEHVERPLELIRGLKGQLSARGLLILSAPTPEPAFWDDPTHVRPYTPRAFQTLAELCGLEVVEITYAFAFLLGLGLTSPIFYRLLNLLPFGAGSNLLGVYRQAEGRRET